MSLELAKNILEKELNREDVPIRCQVDLAGGEPFLLFDEVKEIVEYCKLHAKEWKREFYFLIGTNLTLLNPEIEQWLMQNSEWVILTTSLDGTRDVHNHYRCDSYDIVIKNLPFYKRLYPEQGAKMTLGPDTIDSIYNSIIHIESLGLPFVGANVVYEPVWGDLETKKACLIEYGRQLELLVEHYVHNVNLIPNKLLSLPIHRIVNHDDDDHRWCGSGIHMRAYDTDGRVLPCHRFSRFSTNKIYEGSKSIEPHTPTKCDQCVYISACPTCRAYNWQVYGNPDSRTSHHCEFIKLQLLATAKLQYLLNKSVIESLNSGRLPEDVSGTTLKTLQAAILIFKNLDETSIIEECVVE
jgi:uncharacterized protein